MITRSFFVVAAFLIFATEAFSQGFITIELPGAEKESKSILQPENLSYVTFCDNNQVSITGYEVGDDFIEVVLLGGNSEGLLYTFGKGRIITRYFLENSVSHKIESISRNDFHSRQILLGKGYINTYKAYLGLSSDCKSTSFKRAQ